MLKGAVIFLLVGLVAALLGFTTVAGASFAIAKVLAAIFLVMFLMLVAWHCSPPGRRDVVARDATRTPNASYAEERSARMPRMPPLAPSDTNSVRRRKCRRRGDAGR